MEYGTQTAIANAAKISVQYLNDIIQGRCKCHRDLGEKLQKITGVSKETWVFGQPVDIRAALNEKY